MAKKIARRRKPTPKQAAHIEAAAKEEEKNREANIAQARDMFAAAESAKQVIAQLKAAREERGLSLADLRARTGMTRESISRLENNEEPNPQLSTLMRLATAIGVKLDVSVK